MVRGDAEYLGQESFTLQRREGILGYPAICMASKIHIGGYFVFGPISARNLHPDATLNVYQPTRTNRTPICIP